jgi:predicted nucleic acid-binding protein
MRSVSATTRIAMPEIRLFLDSSVLVSGVISAEGASRVLLLLAETGHIKAIILEQVLAESERAIARKVPRALNDFRQAILASRVQIVRDPAADEVSENLELISHAADVPIVLAAMRAQVDYLVTLNRVHFIDDPGVAQKSGLRIGTPGDALHWVRERISSAGQ